MKLTLEERRAVACVRHGHPRIVRACLGQITCARCNAIVGDTLMGGYDPTDDVVVDHACAACEHNAKHLTKEEQRLLPPDVRLYVNRLREAGR